MSDIWLLTYEVAPKLGHPEAGKIGGAYVNCWIKADSHATAAEVAVRELAECHMSIIELTESKLIDPLIEQYPPASMEFIGQAQVDGAVFCFNCWPPPAPKRRWFRFSPKSIAIALAAIAIIELPFVWLAFNSTIPCHWGWISDETGTTTIRGYWDGRMEIERHERTGWTLGAEIAIWTFLLLWTLVSTFALVMWWNRRRASPTRPPATLG